MISSKNAGALVPARRQAAKTMVKGVAQRALSGTTKTLGVSLNWLAKQAADLELTEDDVDMLISVRTEFGGKLPSVVKIMRKGISAEDAYGCYSVRASVRNQGSGREYNASLTKIARLSRVFPEAALDSEQLDEILVNAHGAICERYFWVHYLDQSIDILCAIAEEYRCSSIYAALTMVNSSRALLDGVLPRD